jgi:hypothetical protein
VLVHGWKESGPAPDGETALAGEIQWKAVRMAKLVLGLHIGRAQISYLYGAATAKVVHERAMDTLPEPDLVILPDLLWWAERSEAIAYQQPNTPPDAALYSWISDPGLDPDATAESISQETLDATEAAARVLARYRGECLERLRLNLWVAAHGEAAAEDYLLRERLLEPDD